MTSLENGLAEAGSSKNASDEDVARILRVSSNLEESREMYAYLGQRIRDGNLVAFPTETVYGLGASAFSIKGVLNTFRLKERPLSDPLIVHVNSIESAINEVLHLDEQSMKVFHHLASEFWPGPLSIIAKAREAIPSELTAFTGYAAVRFPNNGYANSLLKAAGVPISAPSANMFGHISPTSAQHVLNEFRDADIDIIDGGDCSVGLESTVVKFEVSNDSQALLKETLSCPKSCSDDVEIAGEYVHPSSGQPCMIDVGVYRIGGVSVKKLVGSLKKFNEGNKNLVRQVYISEKISFLKAEDRKFAVSGVSSSKEESRKSDFSAADEDDASNGKSKDFEGGRRRADLLKPQTGGVSETDGSTLKVKKVGKDDENVSPGMLLTHYAPRVPTYLISYDQASWLESSSDSQHHSQQTVAQERSILVMRDSQEEEVLMMLSDVVVIDVLGNFMFLRDLALGYLSLGNATKGGTFEEPSHRLYDIMHTAEETVNPRRPKGILITHFDVDFEDDLSLALYDRIYRSASGRFVTLKAG